jgi:CheY-like chemotaxis protein
VALDHELRTPLTPVLMTLAALESRFDLPPDVRDEVTMIKRNVELESKLIDDLLDLSRITSGKLHLTFDLLDVNDLLRHVCQTCRPSIQERGIHLHCDLAKNARDVVGDPGRLQQVFWNLLNNAAKFTPEGGDIYVTTENVHDDGRDGQVRVTVRDSGKGIAPEILPRIFDAFEQGEISITRQFGGLGLGLAISKRLVEQHRGTIRAESAGPDQGAAFIVELPALSRRQAAVHAPAQLPTGGNGRAVPLRLMVVEDHVDTAAALRRLLAASGHTVEMANTAAAALALAAQRPKLWNQGHRDERLRHGGRHQEGRAGRLQRSPGQACQHGTTGTVHSSRGREGKRGRGAIAPGP